MSKQYPEILIISHTNYSTQLGSSSIPKGEVNNAQKLYDLLKNQGYCVKKIQDYNELFDIDHLQKENAQILQSITKLNLELAKEGEEIIESSQNHPTKAFLSKVQKCIPDPNNSIILLLTWQTNIFPVIASGIQHQYPFVGKGYCCFPGEYTFSNFPYHKCYMAPNILLCESLLAPIEGKKIGIPPWKYFYLPHLCPLESEKIFSLSKEEKWNYRKNYLTKIAKENHKEIKIDKETIVIAYPTRFLRRKNVDLLIEAVSELYPQNPNILLVLKGDYDCEGDFNTLYTDKTSMLIRSAQEKPWFLWDRNFTPYPEILNIFSSYDICAYLSGAESGNNTIVEIASLAIPCLILNATTNPYMYKDMALFVEAGEDILGVWIFKQPIIDDLKEKLSLLIQSKKTRESLGKKARQTTLKRYNSQKILKRIPLLLEAAKSYHKKDKNMENYKKLLLNQLCEDFKEYDLDHREILQ